MAERSRITTTQLSSWTSHAIILTTMYVVFSATILCTMPKCTAKDDDRVTGDENTTSPDSTEDICVDNLVYAWSSNFFVAVVFFGLAVRLYFTSELKCLAATTFVGMSFAYAIHGLAILHFGTPSSSDGTNLRQFFLLTLVQYLLWTSSTITVAIFVQSSWKMLGDTGKKCGIVETRILLVLNIASFVAVLTGSLWSAAESPNSDGNVFDRCDGTTTAPHDVSMPYQIFNVAQLIWHVTYCLFLLASSYVWAALAKQESKMIGRLSNVHAASGVVIAQVVIACLILYDRVAGNGFGFGWRIEYYCAGYSSILTAVYNYSMLMTGFLIHHILVSFFSKNDDTLGCDKSKTTDLEAGQIVLISQIKEEIPTKTFDFDCEFTSQGSTSDESHDSQSVTQRVGHHRFDSEKVTKTESSQGLVFSILPFMRVALKGGHDVKRNKEVGSNLEDQTTNDDTSCAPTVGVDEEHLTVYRYEDAKIPSGKSSSCDSADEQSHRGAYDYMVVDGEILLRSVLSSDHPSNLTNTSLETAYELQWDGVAFSASEIAKRIASESTADESEEDDILMNGDDTPVERNGVDEGADTYEQIGRALHAFFANAENSVSETIFRRHCVTNGCGFRCGNTDSDSLRSGEFTTGWRFVAQNPSALAQPSRGQQRQELNVEDINADNMDTNKKDNDSVMSEDEDINSIEDNGYQFGKCDITKRFYIVKE